MLKIKKTNERNKDFFKEMGLYFSRKEIIKEMDCQIYSNEKMTWYIAYIENTLIGFLSIEEKEKYVYIDNFYIINKYRGYGYGKELFNESLKDFIFEEKPIRLITSNKYAKKIFEDFGFKENGKNGKYYKMKF